MAVNQLYRALHMPPARLLRKLSGEKEIYTIATRPAPTAQGTAPLPALGGAPYTPLPYTPGVWYADPLFYDHGGDPWLFCEAFDMTANKGRLAACPLQNGAPGPMQIVLEEPFHLSFPNVFDWNGGIWMLPETGADQSLRLYRCTHFPDQWELAARFATPGHELCDTVLLQTTPDALELLCSEVKPGNGLYVRYRRYTLRRNAAADGAAVGGAVTTESAATADTAAAGSAAAAESAATPANPAPVPEGEPPFTLTEDEAFNLNHRTYDLTSRNAGPLFAHDGLTVRPTQVSTKVDYGVYLQFVAQQAGTEVPLCAATPQNVVLQGIPPRDIIGIHTYCRGAGLEIIDARYLRKV